MDSPIISIPPALPPGSWADRAKTPPSSDASPAAKRSNNRPSPGSLTAVTQRLLIGKTPLVPGPVVEKDKATRRGKRDPYKGRGKRDNAKHHSPVRNTADSGSTNNKKKSSTSNRTKNNDRRSGIPPPGITPKQNGDIQSIGATASSEVNLPLPPPPPVGGGRL